MPRTAAIVQRRLRMPGRNQGDSQGRPLGLKGFFSKKSLKFACSIKWHMSIAVVGRTEVTVAG
jgi:hypothetical protein